ncbi:MAG: hypothetical protein IJV17_05195 [Prevotella sp.]|nr:hypothetical protein [Prevotella sp.]
MKQNFFANCSRELLKTMVLVLLALVGTSAWAQSTYSGQPTGDCWVRSDNKSTKNTTTQFMEIKTDASTYFYGVMSFQFTAPNDGYEVKSATLRLTTRVKRGNAAMKIYGVKGYVIADQVGYENVEGGIVAAVGESPIATFDLKGASDNMAIIDDISDSKYSSYHTITAWQNTIDLTEYVRSLGTNRFSIAIAKATDQNSASQIFTKDATGVTWNTTVNSGAAINNEDILPVLTVEYQAVSYTGRSVTTSTSTADTWVRSDQSNKAGATVNFEVKNQNDEGTAKLFYGLMSFNYTPVAGKEVKSAFLRLTTRTYKTSQGNICKIYPIELTIDENTSTGTDYSAASSTITSALSESPIAYFMINGNYNKRISDSGLTSGYSTIEAWQNFIDITSYIRSLNGGPFSILLKMDSNVDGGSSDFFTKEQGSASAVSFNGGSSISNDDLIPQLVIIYKDMDSYKLPITSAGAATLCLPFASTIPSGVTVYTLTYTSGDKVTATEVIGGTLAANTPVLINAAENAEGYEFVRSGDIVSGIPTVGALTGVYAETQPGTGHYILTNHSGKVGFRKTVASSKVAAYRAYLTAAGGSREFLEINFGDDNVTAIKNIKVGSEEDAYFDLQGQRVLYPKKGLYIVNGKKVIIK